MVFVWYRKYRAKYWTVPGMIDWMFWENPQFMEICLEDPFLSFEGTSFDNLTLQHKYPINQLLLCVGGGVQLQVYHMWDQRCFLTETDCYNFKLMFLSNTTHNLTILIRHLVWTSKNGKIEPDGQVNVWHSSWLVVVTHIYLDLRRKTFWLVKSPPVVNSWTEYLYRSIYSWVRLLFRAWSGILMRDLKEIGMVDFQWDCLTYSPGVKRAPRSQKRKSPLSSGVINDDPGSNAHRGSSSNSSIAFSTPQLLK